MKQYSQISTYNNVTVDSKNKYVHCFYQYMLLFLFLVFMMMTSCGPHIEGYGVVLWAEKEGGLVNGDVVKILSESIIRNAYIIFKEKPKDEIAIKKWRLEVFNTEKEAILYADEYAQYSTLYAYSLKDGIPPVRELAENSGGVKIICKPKAYQPIKILGKTENKVEIDEMSDYWYQVLLEYQGIGSDGQFQQLGGRGYCFGHYLEIFQTNGDPEQEIAQRSESEKGEDPLLNLLGNVWRPSYFSEMINSNSYNLARFKSTIGLFPEPEAKRIIISTAEKSYFFEYTDITEVRKGIYSFVGADLRIEIYSNYRISVTYMADDGQVNTLYRKIGSDIDALVEGELKRREARYENIFHRGSELSSSAYGTILLKEDKTFTWQGFDKLIPAVIPNENSGRGRIDFPYNLASALKDKYDGVITFYFKGTSNGGINFLYKITENGVRLFSVKEDSVTERRIVETDLNPIVIFFTFNKS